MHSEMTRQQRDQIRHKESGLCIYCSRARVNATHCEQHRMSRLKALRKHADRTRARNMVQRSLRAGTITRKPCEECGMEDTEAHHEDYSRPLDITWLCFTHHNARHGRKAFLGKNLKVNPFSMTKEYHHRYYREVTKKKLASNVNVR